MRMSAIFSVAAAILLVLPAIAFATDYIVGDEEGWTIHFDYSEWAKDKKLYVGDTLTFIYSEGNHNVIKVDGKGFASCAASPNSGILTSGQDRITLTTTGNKWYICGVSGHCDAGQKLKITVLPKSMLGGAPSPAPEWADHDYKSAPMPVAAPGYSPETAMDSVPIPAPDSSVPLPRKPIIPLEPEAPAPAAPWFPWVPAPVATPGYSPEEAMESVPIPAPDSSVLSPWKPIIPLEPDAPAWPPAAGFPWAPVPAGAP